MSPKAQPEAVAVDEVDEDEDSENGDEGDRAPKTDFMKKMTPSPELAVITGAEPQTRTDVVMKLWKYIKDHGLQDEKEKRMINADAALRPIFGADTVSMFEMTLKVSKHLS